MSFLPTALCLPPTAFCPLPTIHAKNPRHQRPALRQWPYPLGPSGRVHPDRHLGPLSKLARAPRCVYICADDTHGTAIMIRARQEGRSEEAVIADMQAAHMRDFAGFEIVFDHYGSTHSAANRELCARIWKSLVACRARQRAAKSRSSTIRRPARSWPIVSSRGPAPNASTPDQYGDSCDKCDSTYSPTDLIDPVSTLSGAKPELRRPIICSSRSSGCGRF